MAEVNNDMLILVVGDVADWITSGRNLPKIARMEFCEYHDISAKFLETLKPAIILSPLLFSQYDVLDLAMVLESLAYRGRVRAMAPPLPDPAIVVREVLHLCPNLDFDIIEITPGPAMHKI